MINLKTPRQITHMHVACDELSLWMEQCIANLQAGGTYRHGKDIAQELDQLLIHLNNKANNKIWDAPFFWEKNSEGEEFASPVCVSVNDEIVHSRPTEVPFKEGDIITVDAGLSYRGWCADMARTVVFGAGPDLDGVNEFHETLLRCCQSALYQAYDQCKPGNTIRQISEAISSEAIEHKLGIVVDYMGHGIGKTLHEDPRIPNFPGIFPHYDEIVLRPGMVFCLEPMFTLGSNQTVLAPDKWRVWSQDGSMAAHFESQIVITEEGCKVLTKLAGEYPQEEQ